MYVVEDDEDGTIDDEERATPDHESAEHSSYDFANYHIDFLLISTQLLLALLLQLVTQAICLHFF